MEIATFIPEKTASYTPQPANVNRCQGLAYAFSPGGQPKKEANFSL
jgi:hypothetical protein